MSTAAVGVAQLTTRRGIGGPVGPLADATAGGPSLDAWNVFRLAYIRTPVAIRQRARAAGQRPKAYGGVEVPEPLQRSHRLMKSRLGSWRSPGSPLTPLTRECLPCAHLTTEWANFGLRALRLA